MLLKSVVAVSGLELVAQDVEGGKRPKKGKGGLLTLAEVLAAANKPRAGAEGGLPTEDQALGKVAKPSCGKCGRTDYNDIRGRLCDRCAFPVKKAAKRSLTGQGAFHVDPEKAGTNAEWERAHGAPMPPHEDGYLYHATTDDRLSRIHRHGLRPGEAATFKEASSPHHVSLAPTADHAKYWSGMTFWRRYDDTRHPAARTAAPRPVILRAKTEHVREPEPFRPDEVRTKHPIAPEHLEYFHAKERAWKPLRKPLAKLADALDKKMPRNVRVVSHQPPVDVDKLDRYQMDVSHPKNPSQKIGYVQYSLDHDQKTAHIGHIHIDQAHRGQGYSHAAYGAFKHRVLSAHPNIERVAHVFFNHTEAPRASERVFGKPDAPGYTYREYRHPDDGKSYATAAEIPQKGGVYTASHTIRRRVRKLADALEKASSDDYLYHATRHDNMPSIKRQGLKPGPHGATYFAREEEDAREHGREHCGGEGGFAMLRVPASKVKSKSFGAWQRLVAHHVPPEHIEHKHPSGEWRPVKQYKSPRCPDCGGKSHQEGLCHDCVDRRLGIKPPLQKAAPNTGPLTDAERAHAEKRLDSLPYEKGDPKAESYDPTRHDVIHPKHVIGQEGKGAFFGHKKPAGTKGYETTEDVSVHKMQYGQPWLVREGVRTYIKGASAHAHGESHPVSTDLPKVCKKGDTYYIATGHHRIASHVLAGRTHVRCIVDHHDDGGKQVRAPKPLAKLADTLEKVKDASGHGSNRHTISNAFTGRIEPSNPFGPGRTPQNPFDIPDDQKEIAAGHPHHPPIPQDLVAKGGFDLGGTRFTVRDAGPLVQHVRQAGNDDPIGSVYKDSRGATAVYHGPAGRTTLARTAFPDQAVQAIALHHLSRLPALAKAADIRKAIDIFHEGGAFHGMFREPEAPKPTAPATASKPAAPPPRGARTAHISIGEHAQHIERGAGVLHRIGDPKTAPAQMNHRMTYEAVKRSAHASVRAAQAGLAAAGVKPSIVPKSSPIHADPHLDVAAHARLMADHAMGAYHALNDKAPSALTAADRQMAANRYALAHAAAHHILRRLGEAPAGGSVKKALDAVGSAREHQRADNGGSTLMKAIDVASGASAPKPRTALAVAKGVSKPAGRFGTGTRKVDGKTVEIKVPERRPYSDISARGNSVTYEVHHRGKHIGFVHDDTAHMGNPHGSGKFTAMHPDTFNYAKMHPDTSRKLSSSHDNGDDAVRALFRMHGISNPIAKGNVTRIDSKPIYGTCHVCGFKDSGQAVGHNEVHTDPKNLDRDICGRCRIKRDGKMNATLRSGTDWRTVDKPRGSGPDAKGELQHQSGRVVGRLKKLADVLEKGSPADLDPKRLKTAIHHYETCKHPGHHKLDCPGCGKDMGCDGYCPDSKCPNYKNGALVEAMAAHKRMQKRGVTNPHFPMGGGCEGHVVRDAVARDEGKSAKHEPHDSEATHRLVTGHRVCEDCAREFSGMGMPIKRIKKSDDAWRDDVEAAILVKFLGDLEKGGKSVTCQASHAMGWTSCSKPATNRCTHPEGTVPRFPACEAHTERIRRMRGTVESLTVKPPFGDPVQKAAGGKCEAHRFEGCTLGREFTIAPKQHGDAFAPCDKPATLTVDAGKGRDKQTFRMCSDHAQLMRRLTPGDWSRFKLKKAADEPQRGRPPTRKGGSAPGSVVHRTQTGYEVVASGREHPIPGGQHFEVHPVGKKQKVGEIYANPIGRAGETGIHLQPVAISHDGVNLGEHDGFDAAVQAIASHYETAEGAKRAGAEGKAKTADLHGRVRAALGGAKADADPKGGKPTGGGGKAKPAAKKPLKKLSDAIGGNDA